MKRLQIKGLLIFVILSALYTQSQSQQLAPDTSSPPAFKNVMASYNNSFAGQLHLFNGKEYRDYRKPFEEGQPYFITNTWTKGTVDYDGNRYDNVSVLYNLVTDELIILNYNNISKIQLIKEKVAQFSMAGHSFINITPDSLFSSGLTPGFYDVLAAGKLSLLVRHTKNIQPYIRQTIELKIFSKDHYYLKKNNGYSAISSKKSFLEQFGDKRKQVQQFIRQNKLRYRKDPANTMVRSVEYYNQITK